MEFNFLGNGTLIDKIIPIQDYSKPYKFIDDKKDNVMKVFIDVN